jgi:hypothetical protein
MTAVKRVVVSCLPCPESWIDPEILPLVTLLNRLGFHTIWSCAGFGVSRDGVEQPISRLPAKLRRSIRRDVDGNYYIESKKHDGWSSPYIVIRIPDQCPDWFSGVTRYLKRVLLVDNDFYNHSLCRYAQMKMMNIEDHDRNKNEMRIGLSMEICNSLSTVDDMTLINKMWIHEVVKAFSFM